MYAIYAYIDPPNHPNVGKYAIHGVSGSNNHYNIRFPVDIFHPDPHTILLGQHSPLKHHLGDLRMAIGNARTKDWSSSSFFRSGSSWLGFLEGTHPHIKWK